MAYRPRGERRFRDEKKKKKSPGSIFRKGLIQRFRSRKLGTAHGWPSQGLSALAQRTWDKSLSLDDSKFSFRTQTGLRFGVCIFLAIDSSGSDGLLKMSLNHSMDLEVSLRSLETWEDSRTPEWVSPLPSPLHPEPGLQVFLGLN